jgi:transposase-like protein
MRTPKTLTPQFKFQVVLEVMREERSQAEIARQHDIQTQLISSWKKQFFREGPKIFLSERKSKQRDRKLEDLEKVIGRQTIEIQFLKKVLGHSD